MLWQKILDYNDGEVTAGRTLLSTLDLGEKGRICKALLQM